MGKSTVAGLLAQRGIPVIDTDDLARAIVEPGQPALDEIRSVFNSDCVKADGSLDREALARIVFSDSQARVRLESIMHPRISQLWRKQVEMIRAEQKDAVAVVIPLLFETGVESGFDSVVCVACSDHAQRERLVSRGWNDFQISQRNAAQMPVAEKMSRAGRVVWTEGGIRSTALQVERIFAR